MEITCCNRIRSGPESGLSRITDSSGSRTCSFIMKASNPFVSAPAAIVLAVSCSAPLANNSVLETPWSIQSGDLLSSQVFLEVNSYRLERHKLALRRDTGLDRLAHDHAEFLLLHRGTYGPNGSDANHHGFGARAQTAQLTMGFGQVAENVVCCRSRNAATLVRLWSKSKAHEQTMLAPYQYTGIGTVVANDGMVFSVEMFGERGSWNSGGFMRMNPL